MSAPVADRTRPPCRPLPAPRQVAPVPGGPTQCGARPRGWHPVGAGPNL